MAFDIPNLRSCDGLFSCIADWSNTVTNGLFFPLMLLGFVVVLFIASQRFGTPRAFGFASFVGALGAVFLTAANLITGWIASIYILMGVVGLVILVINER